MRVNPEVHLVEIYTLHLLSCQLRIAVGDLGLCCCVYVTSLERQFTPLFVDLGLAVLIEMGKARWMLFNRTSFLTLGRSVAGKTTTRK